MDNPEKDLFFQLRRLKPEVLHLRDSRLHELADGFRKELRAYQENPKGNPWTQAKNYLLRRRFKHLSGGTKVLLANAAPGEAGMALETALRLRWIDLQTPNFSL